MIDPCFMSSVHLEDGARVSRNWLCGHFFWVAQADKMRIGRQGGVERFLIDARGVGCVSGAQTHDWQLHPRCRPFRWLIRRAFKGWRRSKRRLLLLLVRRLWRGALAAPPQHLGGGQLRFEARHLDLQLGNPRSRSVGHTPRAGWQSIEQHEPADRQHFLNAFHGLKQA